MAPTPQENNRSSGTSPEDERLSQEMRVTFDTDEMATFFSAFEQLDLGLAVDSGDKEP